MDLSDLSVLIREDEGKQPKAKKDSGRPRLKKRDLQFFSVSLPRLLTGGIPILRALEGMERSSPSPRLRGFLKKVSQDVREGMSFKESLETTGALPAYFPQVIYAGEVSGSTPEVLEALAGYLEKEEALRRKIREALAYPLFILLMGFVTLGVLLRVVIPKLAAVYKDFDAPLPVITRTVLAASQWSLPFLAILILFVILLFVLFLKKRETLASLLYRAPVAGEFLRMCALVQFSRLFSLLLESGVVILESLEIVGSTFPDYLKVDILRLKEGVAEGKGFSNSLEPVRWIDDLSKMLVASGEESGRMPESFSQIARDTETRLDARIQILVKLLEPGLILAIGLVVGFVVIGTVLPIFDISGLVR